MPTAFSFSGGGYDYVQTTEPTDPLDAESWLHLDADGNGNATVKIWDASAAQWERTGVVSHGDLTDVTEDAHHSPVSVTAPLTEDGTQGLDLDLGDGVTVSNGLLVADLGNGLGIDANGRVYILSGAVGADELAADAVGSAHIRADTVGSSEIASGVVGTGHLAFDTATQSELDGHTGDTTNPHNVTDDQTGAASALSNHAGDASAHHSPPASTQSASTSTSWDKIANAVTISNEWSSFSVNDDVEAVRWAVLSTSNADELLVRVDTPDGGFRLPYKGFQDRIAGVGGYINAVEFYGYGGGNTDIDAWVKRPEVASHSHSI